MDIENVVRSRPDRTATRPYYPECIEDLAAIESVFDLPSVNNIDRTQNWHRAGVEIGPAPIESVVPQLRRIFERNPNASFAVDQQGAVVVFERREAAAPAGAEL